MHRLTNLMGFFALVVSAVVLPAEENPIPSLAEQFKERIRSVVYVEFVVEREVDRQQVQVVGMVCDDEGLIVLLPGSVPDWLPPSWITSIEIHLPYDTGGGFEGSYLGQDYLNDWHYMRVEESAWPELRPITDFGLASPEIGEPVWGIGMTSETVGYTPYFQDARISAVQNLPLSTGFTTADLSVPGAPVFTFEGNFAGWSQNPFPVERELWIHSEFYPVQMRNKDESFVFLMSGPFRENIGRVPSEPMGDPRPWIGVSGLQPVDNETAEFLGLGDQGGVVISEVLDGTPAEAAGLQDRDIVLSTDGVPLPRLKPNNAVQVALERAILKKEPGTELRLEVVRGTERQEVVVTVTEAPKSVREAERRYFPELGFSIRELVFSDAVMRRLDWDKMVGVVVDYVKPNSPPATAGLSPFDLITEIDGRAVSSYDEALEVLASVEENDSLREYVLLVQREAETSVLRVKRD